MPLTKIKSLGITDGTIVNDDINASAGIVASKLSGVGGTTLLGTLTTTSGTTQTLSSLTLTNYKFLQMSFSDVGFTTAGTSIALQLGSQSITRADVDQTSSVYGICLLDLSNGAYGGLSYGGVTGTPANVLGTIQSGVNTAISTSSTSLTFRWSTTTLAFTRGQIKIYGVS